MRPVAGQACGRFPETGTLDCRLKVLRGPPAGDVHELEFRTWRDRLVQRGIHIAGLGRQVVPRLLPGGDELLGPSPGTSNALINTSGSVMILSDLFCQSPGGGSAPGRWRRHSGRIEQ
jgi:hypothetical protein